jgi:hypothetical protein
MEKTTVVLVCVVLVLFVSIFAAYGYKTNSFGQRSMDTLAPSTKIELGPPIKEVKPVAPKVGIAEEPKDEVGVVPPSAKKPETRRPVMPQGRRPLRPGYQPGNQPGMGGCQPGSRPGVGGCQPGTGCQPGIGGYQPVYPEG